MAHSANCGNKLPPLLYTSSAPVDVEFPSVKVALFIDSGGGGGRCVLHIKASNKSVQQLNVSTFVKHNQVCRATVSFFKHQQAYLVEC
jgi:hypothetical protein